MNIGAEIVYRSDLYFDPADQANASLYLCVTANTSSAVIEPLVDAFRRAQLWSSEPYKVVPEVHKKNYAEQMQFVACAQFVIDSTTVIAARYDHPKFPSDAARWSAWLALLETLAARNK